MRVVARKPRHRETGLHDAPLQDGQEQIGKFAIVPLLEAIPETIEGKAAARRTEEIHGARQPCTQRVIDLIGAIGRRVLASLLPDRRLRVCPRVVKRAISKFQARGPNINRRSYKATLDIYILAAPGP